MSTDPVVLGSLSEVCGAPLQLFELVAVVGDDGDGDGAGSMAYLCLGRQHIFFVSEQIHRLCNGQKLPYLDIERAVVDEASRSLFLVVIRPGQDTTWRGGDRLLVRSQQRELLLERLALCWQTQQMHERFQVRRLPQARASITSGLRGTGDGFACRVLPQVEPFRGYVQESRRGYSFFVRAGFKSRGRCGRFICEPGWSVRYAAEDIELPGGVEIGIYTEEPRRHAGLVSGGHEDLRTVAIEYRTLLTKELQQLHVRVNRPFLKRMNRTGDIAAWDGWEFLVRSKRHLLACVVLRRKFIPPLCDTMQDVVVTLRCPVDALDVAAVTQSMCDVVREECCFVADSIAPVAEVKHVHKDIIQARLDSLLCSEEEILWLEGHCGMVPCHREQAVRFVKSIVHMLVSQSLLPGDEDMLDEDIFQDVPVLHEPMQAPAELFASAEPLLGIAADQGEAPLGRGRKNMWSYRVARYFSYCVDGGLLGERFTLRKLIRGRESCQDEDTVERLRSVIQFLLQTVPTSETVSCDIAEFTASRAGIAYIRGNAVLLKPGELTTYRFNERVMAVLLLEGSVEREMFQNGCPADTYFTFLAVLLGCTFVSDSFRAMICQLVLDISCRCDSESLHLLVPALLQVMKGSNVVLASCATAALVNMSCERAATKMLLASQGVIQICVEQLKVRDDELSLYTLYLLVNLTKAPHHRLLLLKAGGLPQVVGLLLSAYQNRHKHALLSESASIIGQLCNDKETLALMSDRYPVVLALIWLWNVARIGTKLSSNVFFALKQLCALDQNKIKAGPHMITRILDDLCQGAPDLDDEWVANLLALLTMLASVQSNALAVGSDGRLDGVRAALRQRRSSGGLLEQWELLHQLVLAAKLRLPG